ncbi:hypothetical protein J5N97_006043 [Dioscorea zingiberensis]|uniref:Uncharacterized protein n=1 Tax=Dioscorea zingiberensis TaxID=325984 RepID=A0A9D5DBQ5_9LILI|nr:hypothetical protein J5N97_006043 [Dioscorea zingiberensis]
MMSTNISKCNQSVARVNTAESTGLNRGFSPDTEKGIDSSSSSAKHSDGLKKNMVEKASDTSKMNHDPSFQRKIHRSIISSGSGKLLSSLKKNDHQICGDPPAGPILAHVKPSGLRMPSPTMGFFSQGKVSPSCSGQSQRTIQPVISKIPPPRKVTSEKLICESRPLSAATEQKPTMCTLATKSNSVHVVSSRSQAIPAPNCSKPSITALVRHPDVNSKLRMMPLHEHDREGLTSSGNPNWPTNGQSLLPVEAGEGRTVNPSLESNLSDDTHDANLLSENSGEHGIPCSKFSTKLHYACKLQECNLKQEDCDSVSSNLVKNPEVEDSKDGHYPVMIEDKHSIGNSICELQFGYTTKRVDHVTSMDDESSLRLNMEQKAENNVPCSSLNVDLSSSQGTGIPIQALMPETSYQTGISSQSEDAVIALLQEREHSDAVKSDAVPMKNQINAVPFSDEWLAAVESFGEEILELKTGPVQNSPPEKALPEPGPWSPVKRKAQDIGPFDCTKYSKNPSASETQ